MQSYRPSLSDLGEGYKPTMADVGEMAPPISAPAPSLPKASNQNIALNALRSILPKPSMPLGMNVAAGALSSLMPEPQRNALEATPQVLSGESFGTPQKIAAGLGESFPMLIAGGPNLLTQGLTGFGMGAAQGQPGHRLESGMQNALAGTLLGKVIPAVGKLAGGLISPATNKIMARNVQTIHDLIDDKASKGFQAVSQGVNERGISQVPLTLPDMRDLHGAIKSGYLPNTKQAKKMISDALTGDYNALRDMQSELWKKGTKAASSDSILDENKADEIFDLRNRINNNISNHLVTSGHHDLNALLNESRANYKYLQDTFYNKNLPYQLKKLVHPDIRETPKNLGTLLQKDSIPIKNVRNAISNVPENNWLGSNPFTHPTDIESYNIRKKIMPLMKGFGLGGLGVGEAATLWKLFHPSHSGSDTDLSDV